MQGGVEKDISASRRNKSQILSKQSLGISIPILVTIMISYYMNGDLMVYNYLIEIFCASLGAALAVISIIRDDVKEGAIYKYIGHGFLFISLLSFSNIVVVNKLTGEIGNIVRAIITIITFYLEYLVIIISFKSNLKVLSVKKSMSTFISTTIIVGVMGIISLLTIGSINKFLALNIGMLFIASLVLLFIIIFEKRAIQKKEKQSLLLYTIFIVFYQGLFFASQIFGFNCRFESGIFKYMSYYILYEVMAKFLLYRSYENMKNNLVDAQVKQKDLNNTLRLRNMMLNEFKMLIEKSENRYSNLIDAVKDGVIIFYFNRLSFINESALNFLGLKIETTVLEMDFFSFVEDLLKNSTKYNVSYYDNIYNIIDDEKKLNKLDIIGVDGREFEVYFLKIDRLNKLVYIKDITEINKNHELRREYEEYLKEEQVKNEFYSNISHELRTPINLIYSALQLNEVYIKDGNIKSIEKNNDTIKQNCFRLIRTINNFIDTNKISEGYLKPILKVYNLVSIIENISLASNKYIEKIDNTFTFDSNEEEIFVECDKDMMERVILNLLSNSVKYGRRGGNIIVDIKLYGKEVSVYVKNNGYIIEKDVQPFIFDKFTKINKSLNREREGSGLGLFLTKRLIELQGGSISVISNEEVGTEFVIKLRTSNDVNRAEAEGIYVMNPISDKVDIEFSDIYI